MVFSRIARAFGGAKDADRRLELHECAVRVT